VTTIPIADLMEGPIEASRSHLNADRVDHYMETLDDASPVTVFRTNIELILSDGHHRVEAARRLGRTTIEADVRPGSRDDALQFAIDHAKEPRGLTEAEVITAIRRQAGSQWGSTPGA
jgi:ParB-like chromosome segregation protein Spo0J